MLNFTRVITVHVGQGRQLSHQLHSDATQWLWCRTHKAICNVHLLISRMCHAITHFLHTSHHNGA